jgi:PIN domain nuclease of toxin-antitoxin system
VKLLLDTHSFLWWLNDDPRLKGKARRAIADPESTVWVSAATIWEIAIKHGLGRIDAPVDQLPADLEASRFLALSITPAHAVAAGRLPHHHRDPFDRMLVGPGADRGAQAGDSRQPAAEVRYTGAADLRACEKIRNFPALSIESR